MSNFRTEKDSMGELQVPEDALYGAQTQRAINNFPVSGQTLPPAFRNQTANNNNKKGQKKKKSK